jgi:hypothetical protein
LTDTELDAVEARLGFAFADDHRAFLAVTLPVGEKWPAGTPNTTTVRTGATGCWL